MNTYIESLDDKDKAKLVVTAQTLLIWRWKHCTSYKKADIPVVIGSKHVTLNAGVVPNNIALLLSRKAMKTSNMTFFQNSNTVNLW